MRYSVIAVVILGLGEYVPWSYLFLAQMLLMTLGHVTVLPGGSGSVEVGLAALLTPHLDGATIAGAILLWRAGTYYLHLLAGGPVLALMLRRATQPAA